MHLLKLIIAMPFFLLPTGRILAQPFMETKQIKNFYSRYMEAVERGNHKQKSELEQDFLTPEMQKKKGRLVYASDSDPLLRAQDVSDYGKHSLRCKHLEGGWYEVSYQWTEGDTASTHIPMKVEKDVTGKVRIIYVTPYWGGNGYGDRIFDIPATKVKNETNGSIFVETFFKAYVYPYVKMSPTLEQDLKQLRKTYCTSAMQKKYTSMSQQSREDAEPVDPLIGCADFDAFWYSSLKVTHLGQNIFMVSYNTGVKDWDIQIKVTVTCQNGKYYISDIETG